jgi:hypothetical protein
VNEFEEYIHRRLMETFTRLVDEDLEREFKGSAEFKGLFTPGLAGLLASGEIESFAKDETRQLTVADLRAARSRFDQ